jgi:hypothetical protein
MAIYKLALYKMFLFLLNKSGTEENICIFNVLGTNRKFVLSNKFQDIFGGNGCGKYF